jgi:peroxiredoxin
MVAIAREQSKQEIAMFRKKFGFSFPMAPDPKREAFRLLASAGIPRNYVIGKEGKILFQSVGYNPAEFDRMKEVIRQALKQAAKERI